MRFTIKQPETAEEFKHYYHLRWKLLRAPWNQAEGSEIDDIEDRCFHIMAIDDKNRVIGIARLQFNSNTETQIRYMAVARESERKGIGRELVNTLEQRAKNSSHKTIILDAREQAVGFYQKLEYKITGESYLLFDVIQHYRMVKTL